MAAPANNLGITTIGIPAPGTEGNREDLLDAVINLDKQKKAAVFLALPKTTANGMNHEYLIDNLPATSTAGNLEGGDWSGSAGQARTRLANAVQTFRRDFSVSLDQVEYSRKGMTPGVADEYQHQVELFLLATEQSIDARIVAAGTTVASVTASASAVLALMGGIRNWQITATSASLQTAATADVGLSVGGAWSRSKFLQLHEQMFTLGADPDTLAVDPGVKADISADILGEIATATGQPANASAIYGTPAVVRQQYINSSTAEWTQDIQFLRSDYGRVAVLIDRFIPQAATATNSLAGGAAFLFDRSKLRIAFWRPLRHYPLPPTGDAIKGYVHTGVTLENLHPNTVGVLYNITT